jgi:hypothetical protein
MWFGKVWLDLFGWLFLEDPSKADSAAKPWHRFDSGNAEWFRLGDESKIVS